MNQIGLVAKLIRQAMDVFAHRGACGIVGASKPGTEVALDAMHLMTAGRSIQGIVEGDAIPEIFIPQLIDLHLQGKFPFDRLVRFYDFEEINKAIEDTEAGRVIKPVICFTPGQGEPLYGSASTAQLDRPKIVCQLLLARSDTASLSTLRV